MKFIDAGSSGERGWHATELAMKCPQAFAYTYRMGEGRGGGKKLSTEPRPPLLKGSLVHQGLAHYYARMKAELADTDPNEWATPDDAIDFEAKKLPGAEEFTNIAKAAVRAYAARYALDTLKPLHIEEVFRAEVGKYPFTQRLDLVAEDAAGRVIIIDHKTTSMLTKDTASRYTLSGQFLGMASFVRDIWGKRFGGVLINIISMREQSGFIDIDFKRVPVDPAPNALRLFPITVQHAWDRIAQLDASGADPREWPKALSETVCTNSYGKCEWFDHCRWGR